MMRNIYKPRIIYWAIIILLSAGLAVSFGYQYIAHRHLERIHQHYQDSLAYLGMIAQGNAAFLDQDYDRALHWYEMADQRQGIDGQSWKNHASDWVGIYHQHLKYNDSLQKNWLEQKRLSAAMRQQLQATQQFLFRKTKEIEVLQDSLEMSYKTIGALQETKENLQDYIAKLEDGIKDYEGIIAQNREAYQSLNFVVDGKAVVYFGKVENGKANGFGIGIFDSKSIYEGEWKDNLRHGRGKYIWANGDVYEGEFVAGKREGQGAYLFSTGERYEGGWQNDLRHGEGAMYAKDGKLLIEGWWVNDKFNRNRARPDSLNR